MRQKIIYIVSLVGSLFLGIIGTLVVINILPDDKTTIIEKTVSEVNITAENTLSPSIEKVYDAVFVVEAYKNNTVVSSGTGFVYKMDEKKGYLITNYHVVSGGNKFIVINNQNEQIEATLLGGDMYADIAVLSINKDYVTKVAEIGKSDILKLGDTVFTVGAPVASQYSGTITDGIVSGIDRLVSVNLSNNIFSSNNWKMNVIQTDAAINPGNSGGPLCNINGEVIGVTSLKLVDSNIEGMGFAIPINYVMTVVEHLEKGEEVKRPMLGISSLGINETYSLYLNGIIVDSEVDHGVVVVVVENNSPAAKAGIQKGDIILDIDGEKINDSASLRYILYQHNVGDTIKITYYRNKEIKTVDVLLDVAYES